ncbi:hypothetical protein F5Y12DRAFT_756309 [Xylaria sp. FL1777]|nr:hypothetical protein F5Y12DRAFT_756309 [Xylaria sp. FL1777]
MSASALESLPLLVLDQICEYVAECDLGRRSLHAFSLSSKSCCSIAAPQRFSQIRLTVWGPSRLTTCLRFWEEVLGVDNRYRFVRRLKISGLMLEDDGGAYPREIFGPRGDDWDTDLEGYFDMHEFCRPSVKIYGRRYGGKKRAVLDEARTWTPLAFFISQMSGLKDFIWDMHKTLPPCILSVIHVAACRLHIHNFVIDSLIQSDDPTRHWDPHELALATSPSLYSIVVPYFFYDHEGVASNAREVIWSMASGAAPNLSHVWMKLSPPGDSIALRSALHSSRIVEWPGLPGDQGKGNIRSLVFSHPGVSDLDIQDWSGRTDLAVLCHLTIRWTTVETYTLRALEALTLLANWGVFESLHTLVLSIPVSRSRLLQDALLSILKHLSPLKKLCLSGFIDNKIFETILLHHGRSLQILRLDPQSHYGSRKRLVVFSSGVVQDMAERCPNLKRIELPIKRSQGDNQETAIYRAFSGFQRLEHLSLKLRVGEDTEVTEIEGNPDEEETSEEEEVTSFRTAEELPARFIRNCLINSAVDSSLALEIFHLVSPRTNLASLKVSGSCKIEPWIDDYELRDMVDWIGRTWACEYDAEGRVCARELGKELRLRLEGQMEDIESEIYLTVWNSIWPQKTSHWWEDWSSFPLSK